MPAVTADVIDVVLRIPGTRFRNGTLQVPEHAVLAVDRQMRVLGLTATRVSWRPSPPPPVDWAAVESALLVGGEVKPAYLGDYPREYQRDGVCFAAMRRGALLHHPTGSGKTLETILLCALAPPAVMAVIATRASTCRQYVHAIEKHANVRAFIIKARTLVRKRDRWASLDEYLAWCDAKGQRPWLVAGHDTLPYWSTLVLDKRRPFTLVVDESQLLKSWKRWQVDALPVLSAEASQEEAERHAAMVAQIIAAAGSGAFVKTNEDGSQALISSADNRTAAALALAKKARAVCLTTATPIRDLIRDLYAQLTLCDPFGWGSWTDWSVRYAGSKPHAYNALARDTTGLTHAAELIERLAYCVHRISAEEVRRHLPAMRRETLYVDGDQMVDLSEAEDKRFQKERAKAGKSAAALFEIDIADAATRCRPAIIDKVEEHVDAGHKVVIFTVRKWLVKLVAQSLSGRLRKRAVVLAGTGDDSADARREMLAEFTDSERPIVLVGTGHAWGTGIDGFQCAQAAFFLGHPWEPGEIEQWEGRFPRLGQATEIVLYYVIGAGTVLEHVASRVIDKLPAMERVASSGALSGLGATLGGTADPAKLLAEILADISGMSADDSDMGASDE